MEVKNEAQFKERYATERHNQTAAMLGSGTLVSESLFASELLELYDLVRSVLRSEPFVEMYVAAAACLPVHWQQYFWINFDAQ